MRLLSLARAAWQAEGLYLRRTGRGIAIQAGFGATAAIFGILMLVMLHIAGFAALLPNQGPVWSALIVAFADLVLAAIFGMMARRRRHDPIAMEALALRNAATRQMGDTATQAIILAPLLRSQSLKKGAIGAALTAAVVGFFNRR